MRKLISGEGLNLFLYDFSNAQIEYLYAEKNLLNISNMS